MRHFPFVFLLLSIAMSWSQEKVVTQAPLKIGVVGMTHGHVHQVLKKGKTDDTIKIVGFVEPNHDLATRLAEQYGYDIDRIYSSLEEMISATKPEAVTAFNSTYEHLETVRYCAPKGIHIMVEKPLAVNWEHAKEMIELANKHNVHLLTNYETSWYETNAKAYEFIHTTQEIGAVKRIVFHTGHQGPKEIGCNVEFLDWLTDPVLNGGGVLTDFGCYGANLTTWLMQGKEPISVTCVTQQLKPDIYPKVEDDATIILTYADAEVIIQASWNWPHNVKDMEVYGTMGYVFCKDKTRMEVLKNEKDGPETRKLKASPNSIADPFTLLKKVVHENYQLSSYDPSTLANNAIVVKILDAARLAAEENKTVFWNALYPKL